MKKIYTLLLCNAIVLLMFVSGLQVNAQQTTLTTTASTTAFWSASGGIIVFGVKNTNAYPVLITDLSNYAPAGHTATYTFWYNPTAVTGAPAAITTANGWVQTSANATVTNSGSAGIIPIFSGMSLQIPAGTTYRLGLVVSANGPYYGASGSSGDLFTAGGVELYAQSNANSPTYVGPFPGPPTTTPRTFYGSITFQPASPCTNPPVPGTVTTTSNPVCIGSGFTLSLAGGTAGTGQTYQWESSTDNVNFSPVAGATNSTLITSQSVSTYYKAAVTCGVTVKSASLLVNTPAAVSGTFTINSAVATGGTNFQTFADAINYIKCGINGPVVFNVNAAGGPYNEQVTIPPIGGASATNTVTFNGNGRTILYNTSDASSRTGIILNGADHIILDNLIVDVSAGTYGWGIGLTNQADSNTISNCTILTNPTSTSTNYAGIVINGSLTATAVTGNNGSGNQILNNTINGGYYGIYMYGNSSSTTQNINNKVQSNTIRDAYLYNLYAIYQSTGFVVSRNDLSKPARDNGTSTTTTYGLYITTNTTGALIEKNRIHNMFDAMPANTGVFYCIYIATDGTAALPNTVANNLIYNVGGNATIYGLYNTSGDYMKAYHNTIAFDDQAATTGIAYGIYQTTAATGLDYRNNIVYVTRSGTGVKRCIYFVTTTSTITSNNNDLYMNAAAGTDNKVGQFGTASYQLLADWQGANGGIYDQQSISADPLFLNPVTGNYTPGSSLVNNIGSPVGITTDIIGTSRSATTPDPGAYEFSTLTVGLNMGAEALITPAVSAAGCYSDREMVTIKIRNSSTATIDFSVNPVTVTTNVTGAATQTLSKVLNSGTLASDATMDVAMVQQLDMNTPGVYTFNASTSVAGDVNSSNDAMQPVTRTRTALSTGTPVASPPSYCITGGTPTLSVTGATGYSGLQWQQSTASGSGFTNIAGATTTPFTVQNAITQTMYYKLVATCGTSNSTSAEITVALNNPQVTGITPGSRCGPGTVTLGATGSAGTTLNWYANSSGGLPIGTGNSFTTPSIGSTTPYYVTAGNGITANVGLPSAITTTSSGVGTTNFGLVFDVISPFILNTVTLYPVSASSAAGTVTIDVINSSGTIVNQAVVNVVGSPSGAVQPQTVNLNFVIQPGTNYKLRPGSFTGISGLLFEPSSGAPGGNYGYPFTVPGVVSINTSTLTVAPTNTARNDLYYYFYNWSISTGCESARTAVTATVNPVSNTLAGSAGGQQVCSNTSVGTGNTYTDASCNPIATLMPSGSNPVTGNVNTCVKIDGTVQSYNGQPYVQRHYDIEPATNAANATATVTLYFTQGEFDAYNAANGLYPDLPSSPTDNAGKSRLFISQYHGMATGPSPANYPGPAVGIDPADANIVWNANASRWEVTFTVTGFSGFYVTTGAAAGPLPVTLLSFNAQRSGTVNNLTWSTSQEINTSHFVIERSADGRIFTEIGQVTAAGNSSTTRNYQFTDGSPVKGMNYYRLRITDRDNNWKYSEVRSVKNSGNADFTIYPNPVKDVMKVEIDVARNDKGVMTITDVSGKQVYSREIKVTSGNNIIDVDISNMSAGAYIIKVELSEDLVVKKFNKM